MSGSMIACERSDCNDTCPLPNVSRPVSQAISQAISQASISGQYLRLYVY